MIAKFLANLKLLFWSQVSIWALDLSIFAMRRAGLQESVAAAIRRSRTIAGGDGVLLELEEVA